MKVLYLSDGEMGLYADGRARALHSDRMEKYVATAQELESRNAWKYEGAGAQFQQRENPYEARRRMAESACRVTAMAVCDGQLLYALVTPDMGGLYLKSMEEDDAPESSWLSERAFRPVDLHVRGDQAVLALETAHGECHIALLKAGKARYEIVTQGDTQDTAPSFAGTGVRCTMSPPVMPAMRRASSSPKAPAPCCSWICAQAT